MHEYGLMQDVVEAALRVYPSGNGRGAATVRIEVGEFAVASRDSLATAYEILTRGTVLEGSSLEISEVAGHARCAGCGFEGSAADLGTELSEPPALLLCPRCAGPLLVTSGSGITLVDIQLTDRESFGPGGPASGGR